LYPIIRSKISPINAAKTRLVHSSAELATPCLLNPTFIGHRDYYLLPMASQALGTDLANRRLSL